MPEIIEFEDDIEDDEEEPTSGARNYPTTRSHKFKGAAGVAKTGAEQLVARTGNVATVANLYQTGSLTTTAAGGVSAALAPVVAVTGPIGLALALIDSGLSARSAKKTYDHIKKLSSILPRCQLDEDVYQALSFIIKKKNSKLQKKGFSVVPILGPLATSVLSGSRSAYKRYKGTRGVERRDAARTIWEASMDASSLDRTCAQKICSELLGEKIYFSIKDFSDGDVVLKKKIRSL